MKEERIPHGEGQAVTVEASVPVQAGADMAAVGNTVPALKNESIITEDMVIDGSVRTKSNLRVLGQISGDVKCEGSLLLYPAPLFSLIFLRSPLKFLPSVPLPKNQNSEFH